MKVKFNMFLGISKSVGAGAASVCIVFYSLQDTFIHESTMKLQNDKHGTFPVFLCNISHMTIKNQSDGKEE